MTVMERLTPTGAEVAPYVESPVFKFNTTHHETKQPREYAFNWFNTVVRTYDYGHADFAKYFEDGKEEKVLLPDKLQADMLEARFPFSFFPTPAVERHWKQPQGLTDNYKIADYDPLSIGYGQDENYDLLWNNACIRLFGEDDYNHLEVRSYDDELKAFVTKGMFVTPDVMKHLFENNYPIIFLPSVEMDGTTKKWYQNQKTGQRQKDD